VRAVPEPAIANEGWSAGLVYLTSLGDRTSVEDSPGISITNGETRAQVEEQLTEKTAATLGIPAEDVGREHVMLSFTGFVRVPADDVYQFALTSDDGAVLHVGQQFTCDDDGLHSAKEVRGAVALAAGWHRFALDWFNRTGDAVLKVEMARIGQPRAPIAAADLAHEESSSK
jgi:hexosaminidase